MTFCVNTKGKQSFSKWFGLLSLFMMCGCTLLAQTAPTAPASESTLPRTEIFAGYEAFGVSTKLSTQITTQSSGQAIANEGTYSANLNGWATSITGYFNDHIGGTAEFSSLYGEYNSRGTNLYMAMFGPTYRTAIKGIGTKNVTVFGRALFGETSASSGESPGIFVVSGTVKYFTMAYGGGLDINWKKHVSLRPVQADWIIGRQPVDNVVLHNIGWRYMPGIVFTF